MSSYIGPYAGLNFVGNAAIIAPTIAVEHNMKFLREAKLIAQSDLEDLIVEEIDLGYLQKARVDYPKRVRKENKKKLRIYLHLRTSRGTT